MLADFGHDVGQIIASDTAKVVDDRPDPARPRRRRYHELATTHRAGFVLARVVDSHHAAPARCRLPPTAPVRNDLAGRGFRAAVSWPGRALELAHHSGKPIPERPFPINCGLTGNALLRGYFDRRCPVADPGKSLARVGPSARYAFEARPRW